MFFPQCQWVYRAFEDIEELEWHRGVDKKEESSFRPYTVENGSDHEDKGTNGTGETQFLPITLHFCTNQVIVSIAVTDGAGQMVPIWPFQHSVNAHIMETWLYNLHDTEI